MSNKRVVIPQGYVFLGRHHTYPCGISNVF